MDRFFTDTFFRFLFAFAFLLALAFGVTILLSHFTSEPPQVEPQNLANPTVQE